MYLKILQTLFNNGALLEKYYLTEENITASLLLNISEKRKWHCLLNRILSFLSRYAYFSTMLKLCGCYIFSSFKKDVLRIFIVLLLFFEVQWHHFVRFHFV